MQSRASVADSFRVSVSSIPSNSGGGSEQDDIESLGDVYIWGEVLAEGVSPDGNRTQIPTKTDVLIPKPLESSVVLDVHRIACGVRHIAIVTKQGEVFTWGEECGGRLGHGIDKDFVEPHLVQFPAVTNVNLVACGEYHTCAISKSEEIFTWGDGTRNAGLLGHGTETSHWKPKRVDGLEGLHVVSIACGTWHSAFATSDGKLFTFGDGKFGVLGHGDQESVVYPKEVQLLGGLRTIKVACGVWHTAAIVEVSFQSGSNVSSWKLFTWGDGDKYRLGHGNKERYLQPTRVSSLIEYNFHQIACGDTMTVALTTSGHVFTMGGTENGQLGNTTSSGKVPTLVQDKLLGEFVEEISCGAQHVAALTSKSELYTWGRGANGRLGHGDTEDRKSPTLVATFKDRHVKHVSCGSNFTSCICTHKWVAETDQSGCNGCRQGFGITRKRHNCYHCGLVFCHACSSRKIMKAALAPTPDKPHRVCDACYAKLKAVEASSASKFHRDGTSYNSTSGKEMFGTWKATPSHGSTDGREILGQGVARSSRILLPPIIEPVKFHEIRSSKPGSKYDSTSFVRASQVPSHLQLKDIAVPSSLSVIQNVLKPSVPSSYTQIPPANSISTTQYTRRPSPPRFSSPMLSARVDNLRKTSEIWKEEVSKLQNKIRSLNKKSDMQVMEIVKLQKNATEATALAAVEFSNLTETKELVESTINQLKEITGKLPLEIPESKILRTIHTRAEDFLKGISESERRSRPSKMKSKLQNAPDIPTSNSSSHKPQENKLEKNVDTTGINPYQEETKVLQKSNRLKLESEQQNAPDTPVSYSDSSKQQENKLEENVDTMGIDPSQDGTNVLRESNRLKLESEQQNALDTPASYSDSSKPQENKLEENVDTMGIDPSQDGTTVLQESNRLKLELEQQNALDTPASYSHSSKSEEKKLEDTTGIDQLHDGTNVIQESNRLKLEPEQQNALDTPASYSDSSKPEENVDTTGIDQSQDGTNVLQESNRLKLEPEQQNAFDTPTSYSDSSKPEENKLEENVDATGIDQLQDGTNVLQESNRLKLESGQQNAPDTPTLYSDSSKPEENILEENVDARGVNTSSQAGSDVLKESNGSMLEFEQQNATDTRPSGIVPSKMQECIIEESADDTGVHPSQAGGNVLQEYNGSIMVSDQQKANDIPATDIVSYKHQNHILQENVADTTGVDSSQAGGNDVLQESKVSSVFSTGDAMLQHQASKNDSTSRDSRRETHMRQGSRSMESSRSMRQGETQVIEQFESGVFVTLILRPDGIKVFKRVRFSKRRFTESEAEEWWNQNKTRVLRKYNPSLQRRSSSNITRNAEEHNEASPA